jgi:formamidopyrimidine-DNA glycosylase
VPELPEVETVRIGLLPVLTGRSFVSITLTDFPGVLGALSVGEATARMTRRRIAGVERRGKFLIIPFEDGDGIIAHLRMTGTLTIADSTDPLPRFHRLTLTLDDDRELRFADQRKFGRIEAATQLDIESLKSRLGPEPISDAFTAPILGERLRGRKAPVKSLLLDQRIVAGLGNIYVDEALFLSMIHPLRSGGSLTQREIELLYKHIVTVLQSAIDRHGTTFSSFRSAYGEPGENQSHLVVYGRGRQGYPCIRCGTLLQRTVISNRGTSFCPTCQRPGIS